MGVWDNTLEREKYIPGKEIYVLRNTHYSIYLFSNICSEAATLLLRIILEMFFDGMNILILY